MIIKKWIIDNLLTSKGINSRKCNKKYLYLHKKEYFEIIKVSNFLDINVSFAERIYCIFHDITKSMKCRQCNNNVSFISFNKGYKTYCSSNCSSKSNIIKEKIQQSNIKKYGKKYFSQTKEWKINTKQTCKNKYGAENVMFLDKFKDKIKDTNIKKHGVENVFQDKKIKDKIRNTILSKYEVEYITQSKEIKNKIKKTNNKKYDVDFFCQHYKCYNKGLQAILSKYSGRYYNQIHISNDSLEKLNNKEWLINEHFILKKTIGEIAEILSVSHRTVLNYFNIHNISAKRFEQSIPEKEIINFLVTENIIINNRNIIFPYELDIFLPKYKLAIEFNGLYWHSKHDKNYHLNKTEMCDKKDIQLLHIFENEWASPVKQEIWKSIINDKLNKNTKIFGRKCEIKEVDNNLVKEFLNNNHLQGFIDSSIRLGLFYNNELVSIMMFSKKYEWEIIRFCNKKFLTIVDGMSMLFRYFTDKYKPENVVIFADRRYDNGELYEKLGFEFSHYSEPNDWYFKNGTLELLENFDNNKSEIESICNNSFLRIFDCGNIVYKFL